MSSPMVQERVTRVLVEHLCIDPDKIIPAANLREDLGLDSLDCIEIIMALEEEFDRAISDEDVEKIICVQDAINLMNNTEEGLTAVQTRARVMAMRGFTWPAHLSGKERVGSSAIDTEVPACRWAHPQDFLSNQLEVFLPAPQQLRVKRVTDRRGEVVRMRRHKDTAAVLGKALRFSS